LKPSYYGVAGIWVVRSFCFVFAGASRSFKLKLYNIPALDASAKLAGSYFVGKNIGRRIADQYRL
jgi:hypothetical protein